MTKTELTKQILQDLVRVIEVMTEIIEAKKISDAENERLKYADKIMIDCTNAINKLNES